MLHIGAYYEFERISQIHQWHLFFSLTWIGGLHVTDGEGLPRVLQGMDKNSPLIPSTTWPKDLILAGAVDSRLQFSINSYSFFQTSNLANH